MPETRTSFVVHAHDAHCLGKLEMWANAQRVTLPNIGGALCSTLQSLADAHY